MRSVVGVETATHAIVERVGGVVVPLLSVTPSMVAAAR